MADEQDDSVDPSGSMDDGGGAMQETLGVSPGMAQQAMPTAPASAPQPKGIGPGRHLLTGLVGVLLDGLQAGIQAPASDQGPSIAAARAAQMPMQRQEQEIKLTSARELQKTQLAQAHVQQLQARLMASSLDDQIASGVSDAAWKSATKAVEDGRAKQVSGSGTREAAATKLKELHDQASPEDQGNFWLYPSGKSADGQSTWAVYHAYPEKTLQEEERFHLDGTKTLGMGEIPDVDYTFPPGTSQAAKTAKETLLTRNFIAEAHDEMMRQRDANKPDKTNNIIKMVGGKPHIVKVNAETGEDIKDMGEAQPKSSPGDTSKPDRRGAEEEIKTHYKTYSDTLRQGKSILSILDQAGNGNQVAAALAPLENTLFETTKAGVKRVNTQELDMNKPGAGSIVRNANARLEKAVSGRLPEGYIKDIKALVKLHMESSESEYRQNVDSVNERYSTKIPYGLTDGGEERRKAAEQRATKADPLGIR